MLKDIMVYLDGGAEDEVRLNAAESLAAAHGAFLTGLYCNILPEVVMAGDPGYGTAQVYIDLRDSAVADGDAAEAGLKTRFERRGVNGEVFRLDVFSSQASLRIASEARRADLFVTSRRGTGGIDAGMQEAVLFQSGRGIIFVPPRYKSPSAVKTVLVAWSDTREAARAIGEAMPILQKADKVVLAMVLDDAPEQDQRMPGADMAQHLARHGINVELKPLTGWTHVQEALLNEAKQQGADLIVMGGYGHSRFQQMVMGGVTRHVLEKAAVPVLMAH